MKCVSYKTLSRERAVRKAFFVICFLVSKRAFKSCCLETQRALAYRNSIMVQITFCLSLDMAGQQITVTLFYAVIMFTFIMRRASGVQWLDPLQRQHNCWNVSSRETWIIHINETYRGFWWTNVVVMKFTMMQVTTVNIITEGRMEQTTRLTNVQFLKGSINVFFLVILTFREHSGSCYVFCM